MTKRKAALYHLLLSTFVISIIMIMMLTIWYPNGYFKLMGGGTLIYLIGGIDVFIGPLLTFIVYKSNKKSLKFDLLCIGLLQLAAMSYGLYVMFSARPVFTVFNIDTFQVVSPVDIVDQELAMGKKDEWRKLSLTGPKLVYIAEPDKKNKWEWHFAKTVRNNAARYPRLYSEYNSHQNEVIKAGKPLTNLIKLSASNKKYVTQFINRQNKPITNFLYLPAISMVNDMTAIVDAKTGEMIEIIDAKTQ